MTWTSRPIDRATAARAIDCALCRDLVERHADDLVLVAPDRVNVYGGTLVDVVTRHFGRTQPAPVEICPSCGRTIDILENRNYYVAAFKLDRAP